MTAEYMPRRPEDNEFRKAAEQIKAAQEEVQRFNESSEPFQVTEEIRQRLEESQEDFGGLF